MNGPKGTTVQFKILNVLELIMNLFVNVRMVSKEMDQNLVYLKVSQKKKMVIEFWINYLVHRIQQQIPKLKPFQNKKGQKKFEVPDRKAVFFLRKKFFGPSYFETALVIWRKF